MLGSIRGVKHPLNLHADSPASSTRLLHPMRRQELRGADSGWAIRLTPSLRGGGGVRMSDRLISPCQNRLRGLHAVRVRWTTV